MSFRPDNKIFAENAKTGELTDFPDVGRGWGVTLDQTGGKPPMEWMNGALNRADKNQQYQSMTGVHYAFNEEYSAAIGGYPLGAVLLGTDGQTMWQSTVDANTTDPDSAEASGWQKANKTFSINTQVFTSSGTYTPSSGLVYAIVEVIGGGGGGGAAGTNTGIASVGGGGAAGGYCKKVISASDIGSSVTVTVGRGGASSVDGGASSFGSFMTANGGGRGATGIANTLGGSTGGGGGASSGGDVNGYGAHGGMGWWPNINVGASGAGGDSVYGQGGAPRILGGNASQTGGSAMGRGAGGGGGAGSGAVSAAAGGAGSDGIVIVTEYIVS